MLVLYKALAGSQALPSRGFCCSGMPSLTQLVVTSTEGLGRAQLCGSLPSNALQTNRTDGSFVPWPGSLPSCEPRAHTPALICSGRAHAGGRTAPAGATALCQAQSMQKATASSSQSSLCMSSLQTCWPSSQLSDFEIRRWQCVHGRGAAGAEVQLLRLPLQPRHSALDGLGQRLCRHAPGVLSAGCAQEELHMHGRRLCWAHVLPPQQKAAHVLSAAAACPAQSAAGEPCAWRGVSCRNDSSGYYSLDLSGQSLAGVPCCHLQDGARHAQMRVRQLVMCSCRSSAVAGERLAGLPHGCVHAGPLDVGPLLPQDGLQKLDVSGNLQLTGPLPAAAAASSSLASLRLNATSFNGSIPTGAALHACCLLFHLLRLTQAQ